MIRGWWHGHRETGVEGSGSLSWVLQIVVWEPYVFRNVKMKTPSVLRSDLTPGVRRAGLPWRVSGFPLNLRSEVEKSSKMRETESYLRFSEGAQD